MKAYNTKAGRMSPNMEHVTSRQNSAVVHLKKLGTDAGYRRLCGEFLCEGEKLWEEAVKAGAAIKTVVFSKETPKDAPKGSRLISVPADLLGSISPLKNTRDLIFSCEIPKSDGVIAGTRFIVLENMQDPGNVGTVLRTARAFGIDVVILTGECADPYNLKAVRASMGAVFDQCFFHMTGEKLKENLSNKGIKLYGAAISGDCRDPGEVDISGIAVAIGSEGRGLSDELRALCDGFLKIPMESGSESLNAATGAAIFMWEMYRR